MMAVLRAVCDFAPAQSSELRLCVGDLLLRLHSINEEWLHVRYQLDAGQTDTQTDGNVPGNHVEEIELPTMSANEKLFVATEQFRTGVGGDLAFDKGDFIVGTAAIDGNWWHGRQRDGAAGIFPLTHVSTLTTSPPPLATPSVSDDVHAVVRATMDLTAQLDDELSFSAGDLIEVLSMIDEDFGVGRCDGREGSFPAAFVKLVEGSLSNGVAAADVKVGRSQNVNGAGSEVEALRSEVEDLLEVTARSEVVSTEIQCYARALYSFTPENNNELALKTGDILAVIRSLDDGQWLEGVSADKRGIFPASYVDMTITASDNHSEGNTTAVLYGRVMYDFIAQTAAELTVHEGDTLTVVSRPHVDWLLAKHDDERVGLCPANYVDLFPCDSPVNSIDQCSFPSTVADAHLKESTNEREPTTPTSSHQDNTDIRVKPADETSQHSSASRKPAVKQKPTIRPKPKPVNRSACAGGQSLDVDLDSLVQSQMKELTSAASSAASRPQSMPIENSVAKTWCAMPSPNAHEVGKSRFFTEPIKRAPPPRPAGPRPAPAPSRTLLTPEKPPTPVPQRTAPPRPEYTPPPHKPKPAARKVTKRSDADLIAFSPEAASAESLIAKEKMDVIDDLQQRITTIEKDLENYSNCNKELETKLSTEQLTEAESLGLKETSEFYTANINGLMRELEKLKENLSTVQPSQAPAPVARRQTEEDLLRRQKRAEEDEARRLEERRQKMRDNRSAVIAELIHTESEYLAGLNVFLESVYEMEKLQFTVVDVETLIYNMGEIAELSHELLAALRNATDGHDFEHQQIGDVFVQCSDDLQKLYSPYCCNHHESLILLDKYADNEEAQSYFHAVIEGMRQRGIDSFDFGSMLIKPVQRVLKYPLLITRLLKMTDESHVDKQHLRTAVKRLSDVATSINEKKRGVELAMKYRQDADRKQSVNIRTIQKKIIRLKGNIIGAKTVDANFDVEERRFICVESAIKMFVRDLCPYLDKLKACATSGERVANDLADFCVEYRDHARVIGALSEASSEIANVAYTQFRAQVDEHVLRPMQNLISLCSGPQKVITKRKHKLFDYDKVKDLPDDMEPTNASEELAVRQMRLAKADYEALNSQLLYELPRLSFLALEILKTAIGRLISEQSKFYAQAQTLVTALVQNNLVAHDDDDGSIIENFTCTHAHAVTRMTEIRFVPANFDPRFVDEKKQLKGRHSLDLPTAFPSIDMRTQSESQRLYLRQLYAPDQLYVVGGNVTATPAAQELSPPAGTLVGVIKQSDPMGSKLRWFVDTGDTKGLILCKHLTPSPATVTPSSESEVNLIGSDSELANLDWSSSPSQRSTWYGFPTSPSDVNNDSTTGIQWSQSLDDGTHMDHQGAAAAPDDDNGEISSEYHQVVYAFDARNELEISLPAGAVIKVIEQHDLDGNAEWWFVENADGCRGYYPAGYLYAVH